MNIITKLNIRQRVMLVLTVLAAVFLAWQIYSFVHGNGPLSPSISAPARSAGAALPAAPVAVSNNTLTPPAIQQLPAELVNPELSGHQQEYLNLVREYQITKMKRQILDEEAGLANAKKRISDAGKGGALAGLDTSFNGEYSIPTSIYELAYLDRQAGQWSATLTQGGQYTEVRVGSHLPDGSSVISINERGVVLRPLNGKSVKLAFQGSVNVDNSLPAYKVRSHTTGNTLSIANPSNSNAKIAKILGITAVPATPSPATPPAAAQPSATTPATSDVPAAPLTVTPPATPTAQQPAVETQATPPAATASPVTAPDNTQAPSPDQSFQDQSAATTPAAAPVVKPVSVKELRAHSAEKSTSTPPSVALNSVKDENQISWQQTADLQAAANNASN